ncbi:hypothetical protein I4U23_000085 [Adineta vaga]|nr:hypothetical protein I4U23_000085 [Adineta vaga]
MACDTTLPPTLSLNDAADYFAKHDPLYTNSLNFAFLKQFQCSHCKKGTTFLRNSNLSLQNVVTLMKPDGIDAELNSAFIDDKTLTCERFHEVWEMKSNGNHIDNVLDHFMVKEIKCSSCSHMGYTNGVLYDLPRFLIFKSHSDLEESIDLIHNVERLIIKPTFYHYGIEYNQGTVMLVHEEDNIVYLRKSPNGYTSYNESSNQFELLKDVTTVDTDLSSRWSILIYETADMAYKSFKLQNAALDRTHLPVDVEPEDVIIEVINGLLPSYKNGFTVDFIQIKLDDMNVLLEKDGDINDLIIDAYLSITASNAPSDDKVMAVPSYLMRQIIFKKIKGLPKNWLNYDVLLCPINENHHWYIIIIDLKNKLMLQLDSLVTHNLPRLINMDRTLHMLNLQYVLKTQSGIDFTNEWKLITFDNDGSMHQRDSHSCGVRLLVQADAYVKKQQFVNIEEDKLLLYRYKIAETILRRGEPDSSGSSTTSVSISFFAFVHNTYLPIIYSSFMEFQIRIEANNSAQKTNRNISKTTDLYNPLIIPLTQ